MTLNKILYRFVFYLVLSSLTISSFAQKDEEIKKKKKNFEPSNAVLIAPNYTAQFPYGNMGDRFGFNSRFGLHISYKMKKNWLVGGEAGFLFGTNVREGYVLDNISLPSGQFISQNNDLIRVKPQEQGFDVKFTTGKIVPFSEKYPDAGLLFMTSLGFLQHFIAINVKEASLPQLNKTYRKGYDRMANGPVVSQFIGGIFLSRKTFASAYAGLQFDAAFTQGRRAYDFYSRAPLKDKRIDLFIGIKVGWVIPVFTQTSEKEYFYY